MVSSVWRLYSRAQWNPGWAEEITFLLIPSLDRQNTIWFGYTSGTRRRMGLAVWIPVTFTTSHTLIQYIFIFFFFKTFRVEHHPVASEPCKSFVFLLNKTKQKIKPQSSEPFRLFIYKVFWGLIGLNFAKIHWLVGQFLPSNHEVVLGRRPFNQCLCLWGAAQRWPELQAHAGAACYAVVDMIHW